MKQGCTRVTINECIVDGAAAGDKYTQNLSSRGPKDAPNIDFLRSGDWEKFHYRAASIGLSSHCTRAEKKHFSAGNDNAHNFCFRVNCSVLFIRTEVQWATTQIAASERDDIVRTRIY